MGKGGAFKAIMKKKTHIIYTTINAPFKKVLSEERLSRSIKDGIFPSEFREHILILFTEVPISLIYRFMKECGISHEMLKDYYERYIKDECRNRELEEMFQIE